MVALPTEAWAQTPPRPPSTTVEVTPGAEFLKLTWADAEDALTGALRPSPPTTAQPLEVTLRVGSFHGESFTGPVLFSLRRVGEHHGEERVAPFVEGTGWSARFEVTRPGAYELDVGFRTTHHKTVRARFDVVERQPVPGWLKWAALALAAAIVLGVGVRMALKVTPPGTHSRPP